MWHDLALFAACDSGCSTPLFVSDYQESERSVHSAAGKLTIADMLAMTRAAASPPPSSHGTDAAAPQDETNTAVREETTDDEQDRR